MPIEHRYTGRTRDLGGGLVVRRLLPGHPRQGVGPFVFFDHFGPITVRPEDDFDVRPHPHIGLATVTYLFEGALLHRDSLGNVQRIEPGAINWMTAGHGVVHSERRPPDLATAPYTSHGLQLWAALPLTDEEGEPSFTHTPAEAMPRWADGGNTLRLLIGSAFGQRSPVATFVPTLYLDVTAAPGAALTLPADLGQRAVYSVDGALAVDGAALPARTMALLADATDATVSAAEGARYVVIGGAPLDGHRFMWWNYVSSRRERIDEAKAAWAAQAMGQVPGETEFIPLPER